MPIEEVVCLGTLRTQAGGTGVGDGVRQHFASALMWRLVVCMGKRWTVTVHAARGGARGRVKLFRGDPVKAKGRPVWSVQTGVTKCGKKLQAQGFL
eukprot:349702-Chlamydomonas_euryale.AAC.6